MTKHPREWREAFLPRREHIAITDGYLERMTRGVQFGTQPLEDYLRERRAADAYATRIGAEDLLRRYR